MPRMNGTGPAGMGPIAGRGLGPCGAGRGYGYGRCFGLGMGYRQPTVAEEKEIVQDDIAALKEELQAAEDHLLKLENQK